jgi:hypothetical protein
MSAAASVDPGDAKDAKPLTRRRIIDLEFEEKRKQEEVGAALLVMVVLARGSRESQQWQWRQWRQWSAEWCSSSELLLPRRHLAHHVITEVAVAAAAAETAQQQFRSFIFSHRHYRSITCVLALQKKQQQFRSFIFSHRHYRSISCIAEVAEQLRSFLSTCTRIFTPSCSCSKVMINCG